MLIEKGIFLVICTMLDTRRDFTLGNVGHGFTIIKETVFYVGRGSKERVAGLINPFERRIIPMLLKFCSLK